MPDSVDLGSCARAMNSSTAHRERDIGPQDGFAIKIYVTGFGKFRGVPKNPTTVLAERLDTYLATINPLPDELRKFVLSITCEVLETSAEGAVEVLRKERDSQVLSCT